MEDEARQKLHDDMAIAETILSQAFKSQIRLELGEQSGLNERPYIHRLNMLHGSAQLPETVIMKQAAIRDDHDAYDPAALDGPAAQLFNEWAGLQFLGEVCSQPLPAPTFYGGDRERGFILMEDFGDGIRLDHALLGKDEVLAEKTVIALFQTIGRMHAQTIGKAARYQEIRAALGPTRKSITRYDEIDTWDKGIVRTSLDAIDIHPKPAFYNELDRVWKRSRCPGILLPIFIQIPVQIIVIGSLVICDFWILRADNMVMRFLMEHMPAFHFTSAGVLIDCLKQLSKKLKLCIVQS